LQKAKKISIISKYVKKHSHLDLVNMINDIN